MTKKSEQLKELELFIDSIVDAHGYGQKEIDSHLKIDLFRRALDQLSVSNKRIENGIRFEEAIQTTFEVKDSKLHFYYPEKRAQLGSGTHPIRLQPKLLQYLLIHHEESNQVYDIIERFIFQVWDDLSDLDFKQTKTGVTRCFTNTRFAANTLRNYGLLKFTQKEAFKTWELSLPGFVVAAKIFKDNDWKLEKVEQKLGNSINPAITKAWTEIIDFPSFVQTLTSICDGGHQFFNTFGSLLHKCYCLLDEYWSIIRNNKLSQKEKLAQSSIKIKELEGHQDIEKFYKEFGPSLRNQQAFPKSKLIYFDGVEEYLLCISKYPGMQRLLSSLTRN